MSEIARDRLAWWDYAQRSRFEERRASGVYAHNQPGEQQEDASLRDLHGALLSVMEPEPVDDEPDQIRTRRH